MGLVVDTSILVAAERGKFDLAGFIELCAAMSSVYISAVTASELLHGVHRATAERLAERRAFVEGILSATPILDFDLQCARHHAEIWASLESRGERIGPHDLLIAATARRYGHEVGTLNEREFVRVPDLVLSNTEPYKRT